MNEIYTYMAANHPVSGSSADNNSARVFSTSSAWTFLKSLE